MQRQLSAELYNLQEIVSDTAAMLAFAHVVLYFRLLTQLERPINVIRKQIRTLIAKHTTPPFTQVFSFPSNCRNRIRALCNCDFDVPTVTFSISAISSCSYPSTSCRTKTVRYPGGN